jgi:DNA-binding GntR family transcriptional regulator
MVESVRRRGSGGSRPRLVALDNRTQSTGDEDDKRQTQPAVRDLSAEAYTQLREAIRDGALLPGTRIIEAELSDYLKMSRTPVREAIYRLEADGLLSHEPRVGLSVTRLDHPMMMELYTLRETLEGTAARLAAQHASDAEIEALRDMVSMEPSLSGNSRALQQLNRRIHRLISLAAHNRYLVRSLDVVATTLSLLPTALSDADRAQTVHGEHVAVLDALWKRDPQAAERAAREHIDSSRKHRLTQFVQKEN